MSEWKETTLGKVCKSIQYGYTESASNSPVGPKFLRITDIQENFINWDDVPYCTISKDDFEKYKLEVGDICIARTGNSTGAVGFIKKSINAVFASYLIRYQVDKTLAFPQFIGFLLTSYQWKKFVNSIKGGSAQAGANAKSFAEFPISLPPLEEQKRIAAVLSCLDDKIENLRKQNETLEKIAQTLFKHWFIDFEFPNENGQPYRSSGGAMQPSELGAIPAGWRVGKLGDYCTIFRGSSPRPISSPVFFKNGTLPWIKIADATRAASIYISETREFCTEAALPFTRFLKKGSLILSNSATVGIPMILNLDGCIHDGWLSFSNYQKITRNFLYFVLISKLKFLILYADGTVQKNLNTGILREMNFVLASSSLIEEFTVFSQSIFDKILINEEQIQTLTKTRDTLLPELMSGKLRIPE